MTGYQAPPPPPGYGGPPQPPVYGSPAPSHPPTGKRPWWRAAWVLPVAALVALLVGVGIGSAAKQKPKTVTVAGPTTTASVIGPTTTATATTTTTPTVVKTIATHVLTATVTYTPPPPKQFGEGTYVVGTDIQPGLYKTTGGDPCYWARLSSLTTSDIIDNSNNTGIQTVQISASDKAFEVTGSCTFGRSG